MRIDDISLFLFWDIHCVYFDIKIQVDSKFSILFIKINSKLYLGYKLKNEKTKASKICMKIEVNDKIFFSFFAFCFYFLFFFFLAS